MEVWSVPSSHFTEGNWRSFRSPISFWGSSGSSLSSHTSAHRAEVLKDCAGATNLPPPSSCCGRLMLPRTLSAPSCNRKVTDTPLFVFHTVLLLSWLLTSWFHVYQFQKSAGRAQIPESKVTQPWLSNLRPHDTNYYELFFTQEVWCLHIW